MRFQIWQFTSPTVAVGLMILVLGCTTMQQAGDTLGFREYGGYRPSQSPAKRPASLPPKTPPQEQGVRRASQTHSGTAEQPTDEPGRKRRSNADDWQRSSADNHSKGPSEVTLANYAQPSPPPKPPVEPVKWQDSGKDVQQPETPLPPSPAPPEDEDRQSRYPINLGTALRLAGANNLQIGLATERVREALAELDQAEVLWIPSLTVGAGYNTHTGQIQATEGEVIDVNRESVFLGGGPVFGGAFPQTGAAGGPARFAVDISPVDIYFEPLAARQSARAAQAREVSTFNDTLLEVTVTYLELVQGQSEVAIAREAVRYAEQLVELTGQFVRSGVGLEADHQRAQAALASQKRQLAAAEERLRVVSAELARLLRLEPDVVLRAAETQPVPMPLISENRSLGELIAQGLRNRPELAGHQARVAETLNRLRQEELRPWLPNLHLGLSSGGFGGGADDAFGDFEDRTDFDVLAVWELRNLGLGNRALQRQRRSQHRQAHLAYQQIRDRVAAQVTQAYRQVQYRRRQIEQAEQQVTSAAKALPLNFEGIRGQELRAIEAQQAIEALRTARSRYLQSVVEYNQAQFALLRALGQPPESP